MRVAFWWKLNWAWFCVIQCSYEEATTPIDQKEIEPFPDKEAIQSLGEDDMQVVASVAVKKEEGVESSTPRPSDPETVSEPMEDVVTQNTVLADIPEHLRGYWDLAKRLNKKPKFPRQLGENEWLEIGDTLVEFGNELGKYGLLDMDLGLWENEIMHRNIRTRSKLILGIIAAMEAWRRRDMEILRLANAEFRKLGLEERKVMVMAIRDDDAKMTA